MQTTRPVVLSFSGHDPCGGAGVQADIEVLVSHKCHAASVITSLTAQDTRNVQQISPQAPAAFKQQAHLLLNDLPVRVIKIGLIGSEELVLAIQEVIQEYPHIPVVLDPILAAGGGTPMASSAVRQAIMDCLLPLSLVLTPNSHEARQLTQLTDLGDCGQALLAAGCRNVLLTGTHEQSQTVCNQLFRQDQAPEQFYWERLPHSYHGSGCTLAASIAALIAHGLDPFVAISEAQEYTWNALKAGYLPGQGQYNPNRFFWVEADA